MKSMARAIDKRENVFSTGKTILMGANNIFFLTKKIVVYKYKEKNSMILRIDIQQSFK